MSSLLLGGSWAVICGVILKVTMVITPISTHEPPSRAS